LIYADDVVGLESHLEDVYGVRRHFPASQLAEFSFCYSSLKSPSNVMKQSAVVSH
jgi:hypothetical protein